jgi:hypothetical protein
MSDLTPHQPTIAMIIRQRQELSIKAKARRRSSQWQHRTMGWMGTRRMVARRRRIVISISLKGFQVCHVCANLVKNT